MITSFDMTTTRLISVTRNRSACLAVIACGCALFASIATNATAQVGNPPLTRVERRIRDYVRAHEAEQVNFLEKAVNINSGTFNLAGVREVGKLFAPEFSSIGFETKWIALPDAVGRAGHLFAERQGNRSKRLLLIGHLDTVFEGESEKFVRLDTLAAGAGSADMKGGDVVILYALKALQSVGALEGTRIVVALMGDEEDAGPLHLVSKGTVARRGMSGWQLVVSGRQAHSSGIFSPGASYGAIYEAARILNAFREKLSGQQYLTFNPAVIVGGTDVTYDSTKIAGTAAGKDNIIAPRVFARGDLRFISQDQLLKAREAMRAIVADHLPGTIATITFEDGNPAMPPTKGNLALLAVEDSVSRALGQGPVEALDPGRRGGGDISYVSDFLDALDGLGVKGMRSHTPDERVDLRSVVPATERAAILIYRLTHSR